jgi:hypothetical protein
MLIFASFFSSPLVQGFEQLRPYTSPFLCGRVLNFFFLRYSLLNYFFEVESLELFAWADLGTAILLVSAS